MELASSTVDPLKAKLIQWSNHFDEDLIFIASNFSKNQLESQTNPLTFGLTSDSAECKIYEITGQTVNYSFPSNFVHFALSSLSCQTES